MKACPNINSPEWKALAAAIGEFEAMRDFMENETIRTVAEVRYDKPEVFSKNLPDFTTSSLKDKLRERLLGIEQERNKIEYHAHTVNAVYNFLNTIGVEQRFVKDFFTKEGSPIKGAVAAANFIQKTIDIAEGKRLDILDDPSLSDEEKSKRVLDFWKKVESKMPEEAAHWWYRLLKNDSVFKKLLWESHKTTLKSNELYKTAYGQLENIKGPEDLREEAIGHLIAEAIKRIEVKNAAPSDFSFLKKILELINKLISQFKLFKQDPFEVAAMKILSSDISDLISLKDYNHLTAESNTQIHGGNIYAANELDKIFSENIKDKNKHVYSLKPPYDTDPFGIEDTSKNPSATALLDFIANIKTFRKKNPFLEIPTDKGYTPGSILFLQMDYASMKKPEPTIGVFVKNINSKAFKDFYPFLDYKNKIVIGRSTYYFLTNKYEKGTREELFKKKENEIARKKAAKEGRYTIKRTQRSYLSPRIKKQFLEFVETKRKSIEEELPHLRNTIEEQKRIIKRQDQKLIEAVFNKRDELIEQSKTENPELREEAINSILDFVLGYDRSEEYLPFDPTMPTTESGKPLYSSTVSNTLIESYKKLLDSLPTLVLINKALSIEDGKGYKFKGFSPESTRFKDRDIVGSGEFPLIEDTVSYDLDAIISIKPTVIPNTSSFLPKGYEFFIDKVNEQIIANTLKNTLTDSEIKLLNSAGIKYDKKYKTKLLAIALEILKQKPQKGGKKATFPPKTEARRFMNAARERKKVVTDRLTEKLMKKFPDQAEFIMNLSNVVSPLNQTYYQNLDDILKNREAQITGFIGAKNALSSSYYKNLFLLERLGNKFNASIYGVGQEIFRLARYSRDLTAFMELVESVPSDYFHDGVYASAENKFSEAYLALTIKEGPLYEKLRDLQDIYNLLEENMTAVITGNTSFQVLESYLDNIYEFIKQINTVVVSVTDNYGQRSYVDRSADNLSSTLLPDHFSTVTELLDAHAPVEIVNAAIRKNYGPTNQLFSYNGQLLPEGIDLTDIGQINFPNLTSFPRTFRYSHFNLRKIFMPEIRLEQLTPEFRQFLTEANVDVVLQNFTKDAIVGRPKPGEKLAVDKVFVSKNKSKILSRKEAKYSFDHYASLIYDQVSFPYYTLGHTGQKFYVEFSAPENTPFPADVYESFRLNHGGKVLKGDNPIGWFSGVLKYSEKSLFITEVQSDLLQRTRELTEKYLDSKGYSKDHPFRKYTSLKSKIENYYDGWLYVFMGTGLQLTLKNNPKIEYIYIPTSKYYKDKVSSSAPFQYYDKMASVFPSARLTDDGNYYEIKRSEIFSGVTQNTKGYYDVIMKSAISAGLKEQKEITPDLDSDQVLAKDILNGLSDIDILSEYLSSPEGKAHIEEITDWIESNYSDVKPFSDSTPGGELVDSEGNIINDDESEEDEVLADLIRQSNEVNKEEKAKPVVDIDFLLDQLSEAIANKDVNRQNFIKGLIDEATASGDKLFGLDTSQTENDTDVMFYRSMAQYDERYSVLDNPIELDEKEFQQTRGNEIAEKLANKLRASIGVNSQLTTLAHAKEMLNKAGVAYNGEPGFFFNGQVYLVREMMTTEIVFHEFAHPILKAISIDNPQLFNNLYAQFSLTAEGQAIINEVKRLYPEYSEDSSDFKEEALVRGLSRAADAKLKNQPQSSGFLGFIKEFLYNIKQFFRKLFKGTKIRIENLSETTTLDQLADMLMSESFAISTEKITNADVAAFARDTRQQMIDDLSSMEQHELAKLSKNMFEVMSRQSKTLSTKNYKEIRETLSDKMNRSDIKEIISNLRVFQREGDVKFETAEDEIKYMNAHAEAFLNSMLRFNLASRRILEHFKEINKNLNNPTNISRAFYLNRIIRDWGLFLNDIKNELRNQEYSEYIGPGNPLLGLINEIEETLTRTKAYSDKIYTTGVKDMLFDQLQPMAQTIDNYYTKIIKRYEEKGVSAEAINRVKREYEEIRITPKKIDQLLKGELGDAGAVSSFFEGYMNNDDPIVLGFAGYVKDRFTEMNAVIQQQFNSFISSVSDLVNAAGYTTAYSRMQMGKDLYFLDTVKNEIGDKPARKVFKFLNPWMDYEKDLHDLENKLEEAKKVLNEKRTDEAEQEYITALKNLKDFRGMYMHQEFTEEFNKLRSFFQDEVGKKAEAARQAILNKIQGLNSTVTSIDDIVDNLETSDLYWREFKLLYSLYNADGSPKEVDSMPYKIAIRLREHRNMSNKFYKWTLRKGAFESAYLNFKQSLIDNGIKPTGSTAKEFKEKLNAWLASNTAMKLNDKFYEERAKIFARMSELSTEPTQLKIVENYTKIANIISAYKDKNSEPVGSEMPEELLETIRNIEQETEELKEKLRENTYGLTKSEYDMYKTYTQNLANGIEPTDEEIDYFSSIKKKMRRNGVTEESLAKSAELASLYEQLAALQTRETSRDFIEMVNDFLTSDPNSLEVMKKSLKISRFSSTDIKLLQDAGVAEKFFDINPEFKEWFLANTLSKTTKKGKKYNPTRAWTYLKPQDSSYYEKIEIKDDQGRPIETIPGTPALQYWYKEVKEDYVNENGETIPLKTKRLTMLDCIRQGIPIENATVDMKGRFLPKLSGGNKYRNENYFLLEKNSPAKFKLLQELIKQHLMIQEEMPYDSRLDLEAPRYRKSGLEAITSRPINETLRENPLVVWARKIKSFFFRSADDMEMGLNPEEQSVVIKSDLYDDSYGRVPITGMYDIEPDQVSMDVMTGMMRYMQSGVRQKTLLDMMPTARALQSIVQNPDNNPDLVKDGVKIFSKAKMVVSSVLTPQSQKALSIRAQAINAFIEREFEGKTQAGITKNMVGLNKTVNALFGLSSKAFFAFNIPSALKNSFGSRFQAMIEASGGKYFGWTDYMRGTVWGNKVTTEISMELYKFGPKSLDVQLFEMMDPSQGRLTSKISQGTGISRSVFTDTAELGFLTNVRKWTELNATAGVFGAMLKKTLIERTMPDGTVEKISYDNAWEIVDGQIQLKSGIDKKWDKTGAEYKVFVRKVHGIVNNLNGAYASFDGPNANRYLLFRFIAYMKTYFTRMFLNRFQFRYKKGMLLPRYDANLNDISMGYYVEFLNGVKNLLTRYKGNVNLMRPNEITAMKKTVMEVGMLLLISELIVAFLFDFDPDDEDKYEKLREKSGPFPGLFVADDEHPFKAPGWFSNHMLNLALQIRAENDSFIPYPRWGLQDYGNLLNMESVSLQATLDMYIKLFTGITDYADYKLTGDTSALYKREVGPYNWQQEGGVKFANYLAKTLSLSGTTVEPIVAISGLQSRENR